MFLECGRVQDIRPGMPRRLDHELMRRGGCFIQCFRGVGQLFLQPSAFYDQKIPTSDEFRQNQSRPTTYTHMSNYPTRYPYLGILPKRSTLS